MCGVLYYQRNLPAWVAINVKLRIHYSSSGTKAGTSYTVPNVGMRMSYSSGQVHITSTYLVN